MWGTKTLHVSVPDIPRLSGEHHKSTAQPTGNWRRSRHRLWSSTRNQESLPGTNCLALLGRYKCSCDRGCSSSLSTIIQTSCRSLVVLLILLQRGSKAPTPQPHLLHPRHSHPFAIQRHSSEPLHRIPPPTFSVRKHGGPTRSDHDEPHREVRHE